ncbi:hypothetical protein H072_4915 [Dactylellina haptotyla CBS 200.50]|uniref:Serine-rich protein n=1 Tax=Dactylellina haptotyla (strain CBS 200.50) TaxID=1284197 RepID=S8C0Q8_DACHA|nr:hypothetical protein H072_4915 [Dactylellina haptotyla CBS 200.50]
MATERRRPLHQRSNSQINAAGIKQTEDVSGSLASSQALFNNLSKKGRSQLSLTGSFEAGLHTTGKFSDENENVPSRGTSVTSKRTARTDRSSSPGKRSGKFAIHVASSNNSVKSSEYRVPSGPPPYTGPPQDTSTIRFVRRSPSTTAPKKVTPRPSASTLSSVNSSSNNNNTTTTSEPAEYTRFPLFPASASASASSEITPSPAYLAQDAKRNTNSVERQRSVSTASSEEIANSIEDDISNFVQNFPPPPIPITPPRGLFKSGSTIRLVPHSPLGATPVSGRSRSRSNPSSISTGTRSRSSTVYSGTSRAPSRHPSGARPRSRSRSIRRQRRGSNTVSRGSSQRSNSSYIASINAIGLPPTRPLPTPPARSPVILLQETAEPLPSPTTAQPKLPKPILKKARTLQEIEAARPDVTPPIDAAQFPEIQPALSWILEAELEAPAPLKINKPKRARMQATELEVPRPIHSRDGAKGAPRALFRHSTNSTSLSSVGTSSGAQAPALNVHHVKGFSPQLLQTEGLQSQRATLFSAAESSSPVGTLPVGLRRHSSNPSYYNPTHAVPEWARVYYGRGAPLPNHQEEDDDLVIKAIRRPKPAHLLRINTHASNAGSVWMGTLNPEGQDLRDQFNQPHLDNFPVDRNERVNIHLVLACVGFVFPIAWFIGAFHPLPPQKRRDRRERQEIRRAVQGIVAPPSRSTHVRGPSITHYEESVDTESLPSFTTFEEGRRWDNARWWRNLNRILSVLGLLIIGAIIALLVVGLKGHRI